MKVYENGRIVDKEIIIDETMTTDIEISEPTEIERIEALESAVADIIIQNMGV